MRTFKALIVAAAALCAGTAMTPVWAAGTTRIETRPFYGAVVTIEEGVRVFRPLPPTERVIVNPNGATPLSLGFNETYVNERNYNYNYNETSDGGGSSGGDIIGGYWGGYGGYGRNGAHGRQFGRGHHRGGGGGVPAFGGGRGHGGKH
ncbi:MAG: hypothetical protein AB7U75_17475 [Hyphomicrobiaceae bacterium]